MEALWSSFFADPMFYFGAICALVGVVGFVLFMSGFAAGVMHALKENGHAEHVHHQRVRAVWGFLLMLASFVVWEILRYIAAAL